MLTDRMHSSGRGEKRREKRREKGREKGREKRREERRKRERKRRKKRGGERKGTREIRREKKGERGGELIRDKKKGEEITSVTTINYPCYLSIRFFSSMCYPATTVSDSRVQSGRRGRE